MGIDYSMTNPAAVIYDYENKEFNLFVYMSNTKSKVKKGPYLYSTHLDYSVTNVQDIIDESINASIERYTNIAQYFISFAEQYGVEVVFLEGYSLGSKGQVFNIAENTAVLKLLLKIGGFDVRIFPPTRIKKFATGKGNANKDSMKESFFSAIENGDIEDTVGKAIEPVAHYKESPLSDIIDAWYVLQYGLTTLQ